MDRIQRVFLFDTETTGFVKTPIESQPDDVQPWITQIHGYVIEHDKHDYGVVSTYGTYLSDAKFVSQKITDLTGITMDTLKGAPKWSEARQGFFDVVDSCEVIVAHNLQFDARMIHLHEHRLGFEKPFQNIKRRCTLDASRKFNKDAQSHNLGKLYAHVFGKELENQHTADADAFGLVEIYMDLVRKGGWSTPSG